MIAAPTLTGCCVINVESFSLANTPGEINVSAMLFVNKFNVYYKYVKGS
jgi:hypothetical protein